MKLSTDVAQVLSQSTVEGNHVKLPNQIDRKLYVVVDRTLQALGGKWNKKVKAHVFEADPTDAIERAIETREVSSAKDDLDFFPTPQKVVNHLMELAEICNGDECLEPSAGRGAISQAMQAYSRVKVDVCEVHPPFVELLQNQQADDIAKYGQDDIGRDIAYRTIYAGDFLELAPKLPKYDRIVMNPPFSRRRDIDHVLAAAKLLKKGGRLVAVMSAGVEFRTDRKTMEFKQYLTSQGCTTLEELPPFSFRESGTDVNTVVLVFDKG